MPCPLCGRNHPPGPCPPPTRARSNALTGRSDPRAPESPAQQDLRAELAKPLVMDASLRSFLRKVFARRDLMAGPDNLANAIYNMYSDSGAGGKQVTLQRARNFVNNLWAVAKTDLGLNCALQYAEPEMTLRQFQILANDDTQGRKFLALCDDFFYFTVLGGHAECRVYANAKFNSVPDVFGALRTYIRGTPNHGVTAFKISGPACIEDRADTIVIDCATRDAAEALAAEMAKLTAHLNPSVPEMTTQVKPGVGISVGAEPVWQATGLGNKGDLVAKFSKQLQDAGDPDAAVKGTRLGESAQSFGSIRSELIAAAIYSCNANKAVMGQSFDVFAKFVAVAFRGAGLDPARPGD